MPIRIIPTFVVQCGQCHRFYSDTAPFTTDSPARATSFGSTHTATQQAEAHGWTLLTFSYHCPACTHPTARN